MSGLGGDCAGELRRLVEATARAELDKVVTLLWRAVAESRVSETEATAISARIEERKVVPTKALSAPRRVGSRPRTDASMERRRRWAASGRLPPQLAARFTLAEQAVLAVVAAEVVKRGACRLCHEAVAGAAGVSRSTVRATLRRARDLGLVTIEEQRLTPWRSLPSVVRIVSAEWTAWNRLVRRAPADRGLCVISPASTSTKILESDRKRPAEPWQGLSGGRMAERPSLGRAASQTA